MGKREFSTLFKKSAPNNSGTREDRGETAMQQVEGRSHWPNLSHTIRASSQDQTLCWRRIFHLLRNVKPQNSLFTVVWSTEKRIQTLRKELGSQDWPQTIAEVMAQNQPGAQIHHRVPSHGFGQPCHFTGSSHFQGQRMHEDVLFYKCRFKYSAGIPGKTGRCGFHDAASQVPPTQWRGDLGPSACSAALPTLHWVPSQGRIKEPKIRNCRQIAALDSWSFQKWAVSTLGEWWAAGSARRCWSENSTPGTPRSWHSEQ